MLARITLGLTCGVWKVDSCLLVPFVTEEASVLGRVVFRQRRLSFGGMALFAELLRLFFVHLHEFCMIFIIGQMLGGFLWGVPEKKKNAAADHNKNQVVDEDIFSFGLFLFSIHWFFLFNQPFPAC